MKSSKNIVVIGGGYTGLSAAAELVDKGFSVTLIEKNKELGGLGRTIKLTNGFRCEAFYHHFFTHDKELLEYTNRFLNKNPTFDETKMAIFFRGKNYSWNGVKDLIKYPHVNFIGKFRFLLVTLLLSKNLISKNFLDNKSLSEGLKKLYGVQSFQSIWEPMIKGKFGNKVNKIPLRWMEGRLKQRIESRKGGKERLGFLEGSILSLTEKIVDYINSKNSKVLINTDVKNLSWDDNLKKYKIEFSRLGKEKEKIYTDNIIFTTSSLVANKFIKNINQNQIYWASHKYFTAYCIVLELYESLSKYYWTNIASEELFFCGYIEQTRLTKAKEYGGLHIAYLTKYISLEDNENLLTEDELKSKSYFALENLFPDKNIKKIIKKMHFSISTNAQVITDFNFKKVKMDLLKEKNLYLGNMSNVYPDERSINNAIKVGKNLARFINQF